MVANMRSESAAARPCCLRLEKCVSQRSRSLPLVRNAVAAVSAVLLVAAIQTGASASTISGGSPEADVSGEEVVDQESLVLEGEPSEGLEPEGLESPQSGDPQSGDLIEQPQSGAEAPQAASRSLRVAPPTTVTKCEIPLAAHNGSVASGSVKRIDGVNRYATALNVAKTVDSQSVGEGGAVFIASGADYADGLTLGALASAANWPLLLTHPRSLDGSVRDYISKMKPTHIYIGGGVGAVSENVENQIRTLAVPNAKIERFDGKDRYQTSLKISDCFEPGLPVFVATGQNYADAVIAGAPAAKLGAPIVLTKGTDLRNGANQALSKLQPSSVEVIGGTWGTAQKNAASTAAGGAPVKVHSGKDRYATGAQVAKDFYDGSPSTAVFAIGSDFPDALAGAAVAKLADAPVLLTNATCRPKAIEAVSKSASTKVLLGGAQTLSDKAHSTTCVNPPKPTKTLLSVAKAQVGKAYVAGGVGPNAFDCSGLTQYVYRQMGISIPRTSWEQLARGTRVASPRAGDIVVLGGGSHVGIYVSPGVMIDAGNPRVGVSQRAIYSSPTAYVRFG